MIFIIRKNDFKLYVFITILATIISVYSIYLVANKFGKLQFAEFAYFSIISQIIFTISDLGTKISYFKADKKNQKIEYKYLLASKLLIALLFFTIFSFFIKSSVYYSFVLTVIGTSIFPNTLLQEYKLYTIVSINNLLFRLIPILFILRFNSIVEFSLFSGAVIFLFSIIVLIKLKIISSDKFSLFHFKKYFKDLLISNKYLSAINLLSIIEINLHTIVAKKIFPAIDFSDYVYLERYVNYLKQSVIYLYDYLFPKVNLHNLGRYVYIFNYIFLFYIAACLFIFAFIYYLNITQIFGIKITNVFYFFCLYPLSSLMFNFLVSIIFFKFSSDKHNLSILFSATLIKIILIFAFSKLLGIQIVPIALILAEIFMGLLRYKFLPISIRASIKLK
jgi:O-antigen/teichoic acid export membrane protein